MKDFILAAMPWVLMGVSIAIILAGFTREESKENKKKRERRLANGAAFGLLFGVVLNSCGFWDNHALGIGAGPLVGMAIATIWRDKQVEK